MNHTYIVISKSTGQAVFEFFTESLKSHINTDKYRIMTGAEYLPTLNNRETNHVPHNQ